MQVILPMSRRFLMCNAIFYVPLLYVNLLRFTIQGLGYSGLAVVAGVFEMIARGLFGLCLVPLLGFEAVCFANPAAWVHFCRSGFSILCSKPRQDFYITNPDSTFVGWK